MLEGKFVDTKNVAYDYDVTANFTWDFRSLVDIKKKKRIHRRYYRPNAKTFLKQRSVGMWNTMKEAGRTVDNSKLLTNYKLYVYHEDKTINQTGAAVPNERGIKEEVRVTED